MAVGFGAIAVGLLIVGVGAVAASTSLFVGLIVLQVVPLLVGGGGLGAAVALMWWSARHRLQS